MRSPLRRNRGEESLETAKRVDPHVRLIRNSHGRYFGMKSALIDVLMGAVILLMISSCATVPTEPLGPGEVRLLKMDFPDESEIRKDFRYLVTIQFEAEGGPEITRVCLQWTGYGTTCTKVLDYGNGMLKAEFPVPEVPGSYAAKSYVYYMRNGKIETSNVIVTPVNVKGEKKPMR
jgi:hypothetical protein